MVSSVTWPIFCSKMEQRKFSFIRTGMTKILSTILRSFPCSFWVGMLKITNSMAAAAANAISSAAKTGA